MARNQPTPTSTDVAERSSTDLAEHQGVADGLEDVDAGDILLPIIKIVHDEGVFQDSLSNEKFEEFDAIVLGLVKNRILWPSVIGEETGLPVCRSLDFKHGRPNPVKFTSKDPSGEFPSKVSRFGKDKVTAVLEAMEQDPTTSDPGDLLLCASCNLKEWDTMPGNTTPWCSEQYIFPLLRVTDDGGYAPGYITFQRAALKACRAYISVFKGSNKPMYTSLTHIKALHQRRGKVNFITPEFTKLTPTDPELWAGFSTDLSRIREFLTTPRPPRDANTDTDDDDDDDTPAPKGRGKVIDTTATEVVPDDDDDETEEEEDEPTPSAKGKAPAPADDDDEDEEPF